MKTRRLKKYLRYVVIACVLLLLTYGAGRLYFKVTGGFRVKHISSDFSYDPRWETHPISQEKVDKLSTILSQTFTYLGKGCQSYVFLSEDGEYVIKFLKYQRFRPQFYLHWFSFLPPVQQILEEKIEKKRRKREALFSSWVTAFNNLQDETGLVYVHLNKTNDLNREITIVDKIGVAHQLEIDKMEFLVQKRAKMLCPTLDELVECGKEDEAKSLLSDLMVMILSEYHRGFADNDHALMQNTGVFHGKPIHVDVGQFVENASIKDPSIYHQELYNKTWKFRNWLRDRHPDLLTHLEKELISEMGDRFYQTQYIPKVH